jgi:hypothetical protein
LADSLSVWLETLRWKEDKVQCQSSLIRLFRTLLLSRAGIMSERMSISLRVGRIAAKQCALAIDHQEALEQLGKDIVEELRRIGLYVNETRGDPSGRWK